MIEAEIKELMSAPNAVLKATTLQARPEPAYQQDYAAAHRAVHASIAGEMYNWRHRFVGRSALEFKHCVLTINIRRNQDLQANLDAFFAAWSEEGPFLAKALTIKWLVSACDTFSDYGKDDAERATALIGAAMVKTVKLYETERLFRLKKLERAEWPEYKAMELFDGLNTFNIGYGDVVINFKRRIKNLVRRGTPTSLILDEIFERLCVSDTAFARWRAVHEHEPTQW